MAKLDVCALHKSGSMFLYSFFKRVAQNTQHPFVSINEPKYNSELLSGESYIHCPLRSFPKEINPEHVYIFQIRDPRDCLVSEYYWFGYMADPDTDMPKREHQQEIRSHTIDEYACKRMDMSFAGIGPYVEGTKDVIRFIELPNVIVVKYEQMVTDFPTWTKMAVSPFDLPQSQINLLIQEFGPEFNNIQELTPERILNGEKNFVRKMYPGDYLDKLKPETIEYINKRLESFITFFGYS